MKTTIKREGDTVFVHLEGKVNYEAQQPLKDNLSRLVGAGALSGQVIVNMKHLEFVGSSGISNFVQTLMDFNHANNIKPQYWNVGVEFQKIIKAFDADAPFDIQGIQDSQDSKTDPFSNH